MPFTAPLDWVLCRWPISELAPEVLAHSSKKLWLRLPCLLFTANGRAATGERSRSLIVTCGQPGPMGHRSFGPLFPASLCWDRSVAVSGVGDSLHGLLASEALFRIGRLVRPDCDTVE